LAHGLDRTDAHTTPPARLAEEPEVLLAVRRDLAQHRDALVTVVHEPTDDERRIATTVTIAEAEAIVTLQPLRARPRDQRHLHLVRERCHGDRVVGAVRAGHTDAALVNEILEA